MNAKAKPQPSTGAKTKVTAITGPAKASPPASSIFGMLDDIKGMDTNPTTASIADVIPDAGQHREHFDETELENLAESIREVGILQPIVVSPTGGMPPWKILDGERRWRAAKIAQLDEVPIRVRDDLVETNGVRHLAQLIANTNKSDLRDYEMAKAIQRELDKMGNKHGDNSRLAKLLNRPAAAISRYLSMLDPQFEPLVRDGIILSADVLARFKALSPEVRAQLLVDQPPGKPLTESQVREAGRKANAPPAAEPPADAGASAEPASPDSTTAAADASGAGPGLASNSELANAAQALAAGATDSSDDSSETSTPGNLGTGAAAPGAEDDDNDLGFGTGRTSESGQSSGGASSSTARGAGTPREKAVQLATTAERVEQLLRYFVDKSTDRVELRVPADLAIAIIENLGGEVPDDKDRYAGLIMDLLDAKLG